MQNLKALVLVGTILCCGASLAAPAKLYQTSGLQSPVRAGPDDLLLLAGENLLLANRVVYRVFDGTEPTPADNATIPTTSTDVLGMAEIIAPASNAEALVVRLPLQFDRRKSYTISVANPAGEWSNAVRVNEVRPYWSTPSTLPASGTTAGIARRLKIVGQNLAASATGATLVRLRGPQEFTLTALAPRAPGLDEYVAEVLVPKALPVGDYAISITKDRKYWADLETPLRIVPPERPRAEFAIGERRFGGCKPDDVLDDTRCAIAAVAAAAQAGGGAVRFDAGVWRIDDPSTPGVSANEGILLPRGVSLAGARTAISRIERSDNWNRNKAAPTFTLLGNNSISNLTFHDATKQRDRKASSEFIKLGRTWRQINATAGAEERLYENISIVDSRFFGAAGAIHSGGMPLKNLIISRNQFRAYRLALSLGGDAKNVSNPFRIEDAIVTQNVFQPGSYFDPAIRQGTFATEFGAGRRVDFSENSADGASVAGLDAPGDQPGWRAAFFWHLQGPQEQLLISNNSVTCSGDKTGDGEAIALDNNHNTMAFEAARPVLAADATTVAVLGPVAARPHGQEVDRARFYIGHWLQIAEGTGVGQSRRVTRVDYDAQTRRTVFTVAPAWDVIPARGESLVSVARTFWQTFIVANRVDHRRPLCKKSNRTEPEGGAIAVWGQSSDSVVAHNRQFDTDGIVFHQTYGTNRTSFNAFLDIRANEIRGEYDGTSADSKSGIRGPHGAAPELPPPVESFAVTIAHNTIVDADDVGFAAISIPLSWHDGPAPHQWPLIDRLLVFHNYIGSARKGIEISLRSQVSRAVLYANRCESVDVPISVSTERATVLCKQVVPDSCECRSMR